MTPSWEKIWNFVFLRSKFLLIMHVFILKSNDLFSTKRKPACIFSNDSCTCTYTFGHDYLDAERASCLMNTHWNTVSSKRPSSTSNSTFPGLGFESQSRQFLWCESDDKSYQSIDKFIQTNILHWLTVAESWEKEKNRKIALTGIRTPDLENVEFEKELVQYAELQRTLDTRSETTL